MKKILWLLFNKLFRSSSAKLDSQMEKFYLTVGNEINLPHNAGWLYQEAIDSDKEYQQAVQQFKSGIIAQEELASAKANLEQAELRFKNLMICNIYVFC